MTIVNENVDRVCSTCGATLARGARKCTQCAAYQGECNTCGLPIPDSARRCPECKAFQEGHACRSCGVPMPASAKRCPECKTLQNWRANIPDSQVVLALLVSLVAVISAVAPAAYQAWNNRSDTYVRAIGQTTIDNDSIPVLLVLVANNGGRPALVRGASMVGKGLPIALTPLTIVDPTQELVLPSRTAMLRLTALEINTPMHGEALGKLLAKGDVTINVDIEETGRLGGRFVRRQSDDMKGANLELLVQKRVPD